MLQKSRITYPSANNPQKGGQKNLTEHFYAELDLDRLVQFCTVLTLMEDKHRPMLKKKGPINMSIKLVQITWVVGSVIMQPWIIGITTLRMENSSSSCVLIYRTYIIIIHIKVNVFLSLFWSKNVPWKVCRALTFISGVSI